MAIIYTATALRPTIIRIITAAHTIIKYIIPTIPMPITAISWTANVWVKNILVKIVFKNMKGAAALSALLTEEIFWNPPKFAIIWSVKPMTKLNIVSLNHKKVCPERSPATSPI